MKRRGATTGQGAKVRREGQAPLPSLDVFVPAIDSLEEISGWLGTFRERLRVARTYRTDRTDRTDELPQLVAVV